jgi:hypothetical protein
VKVNVKGKVRVKREVKANVERQEKVKVKIV